MEVKSWKEGPFVMVIGFGALLMLVAWLLAPHIGVSPLIGSGATFALVVFGALKFYPK